MGVNIEEEWRLRRRKSEAASKSAFTFKINSKLKQAKTDYGYGINTPYSREVVVKITGGALSKKGIRDAVQYMSQNWELELIDSEGNRYNSEGIKDAVKILQRNAIKADQGRELKLTQNIVFSAPKIAEVKKEDSLKAVIKTLKEKYPDNYFVAASHDETDHPHVHIVFNINKNNGDRIDIKKKDLRDLREIYCRELTDYGYDVKATSKYELQELTRENVNVYQVVDFGTESYQLDHKKTQNNYLIYRTANNKEVVIWGKEFLNELEGNNIKKGDQIKIKITGHDKVKVPRFDRDGITIIGWKEAKRNRWCIEKVAGAFKIRHKESKEIRLDSLEQATKQRLQKQKFDHETKLILDKGNELRQQEESLTASLKSLRPKF